MDAQNLKDYIKENNRIELILESLGCGHIKYHSSGYWTCSNPPPSDNPQAITVYNDSLQVVNYTKDIPHPSDIISLVEYFKDINFFHALKYIHEILNLDFYKQYSDDLPESLQITRMLKQMNTGHADEDDTPIQPISEDILKYYHSCVNDMFLKDGISYQTQVEWQIGYDDESNRITIPVRDETNQLVSVKGRLFKDHIEEWEQKYLYLYKCPRNKILFGLNKTYPFIKQAGICYVGESEKSVMQLWSYGYKNCVATSGERVSKVQIEKLSRLGVPIVICFDKDVDTEKIEHIAEQFVQGIEIFAIYDVNNILEEKQSPMDNLEKWKILIKENIYKIR